MFLGGVVSFSVLCHAVGHFPHVRFPQKTAPSSQKEEEKAWGRQHL